MNARRDPDAILAAWLDEGPDRLPAATKRAIAVTTRTTHQTRRPMWVPWRFPTMNGTSRLALAAMAVVAVALGGLYLFNRAPQGGVGGPGPSTSPSPSPTSTLVPSAPSAGTITLTDSGCTWSGNPGSMALPPLINLRFRNETSDHGHFNIHWVRPGHTYAEGVDFVSDLQRRLTTGEDWPPNDISAAVDFHDVPAGADTILGWATAGIGEGPLEEFRKGSNWRWEPGTYGIICSANTSPTGDILTTFLVGPLELMDVTTSPGPSASR